MRSTAEKNLRGAAIDWGWDQKMGESWVYFLFFATGLALKCRGNHFCIPLAGRSDSSSAGAGGMRTKGVIYSLSSSCYIPEEQTHGAGFLPQPLWASTCNSVIIFFKIYLFSSSAIKPVPSRISAQNQEEFAACASPRELGERCRSQIIPHTGDKHSPNVSTWYIQLSWLSGCMDWAPSEFSFKELKSATLCLFPPETLKPCVHVVAVWGQKSQ